MDDADGRALVEHGYDALSYHYRAADAGDGQYAPWLAALHRRLPGAATVLDLGCGCGVPAARFLAAAGHHVTGVDISSVQVERARRLVPTGTFLRADATRVDLPRARPHPPAPARAAPPHRAHLHLAAPGRLAAGHRRRQRVDGHRGELARRPRRHVVEPCRRVDLPLLAAAGHRAGRRHVGQVAVSRPPDTPMSPTWRAQPGAQPRRGWGRRGFGTKVPFDISSSVVCCFPMRGARGLEACIQ
ncbi:class I SAM-dependent methyltransferase [Micromonospora harpali]|uniref:Class I SAM-dependent methyltransferase n=1 Tax=Micromonospora harpali TaxID=1490225 RepID=A0ABW1HGF5_9ACTN